MGHKSEERINYKSQLAVEEDLDFQRELLKILSFNSIELYRTRAAENCFVRKLNQ